MTSRHEHGIDRPAYSRWRALARMLMHLGAAAVVAAYVWRVNGGSRSVEMELCPGGYGQKPFGREIFLESFSIGRYPDGSPSSYESEVTVDAVRHRIGVNRPWHEGPCWIIQSSWFEIPRRAGGTVKCSVLTAMHDSSWPFALAGFAFLLAGAWLYAVLSLVAHRSRRTPLTVTPLACATILMGLAAAAMAIVSTWRTGHPPLADVKGFLLVTSSVLPWLALWGRRKEGKGLGFADFALEAIVLAGAVFMKGRSGGLPPALQSGFFLPHVASYVIGYIILARAAISGGAMFVPAGFALVTTGMVLGSMWGEICWGAWWSFDPKETWSLVTWLVFAASFHVARGTRLWRGLLWAGLVLIAVTIAWVNFSRLFAGLHSYAS